MKCPVDGNTLVITERSGVEIDYCPSCRGVWLDRGELDKILDRAKAEMTPAAVLAEPAARDRDLPDRRANPRLDAQDDQRRRRHDDDDDDDDDRKRRRHKKRESFLSDLFDF
ncbi:MAG: zf-TFIIB domain-containing protein [Paracoccaceae bacterium]|nr:zf-TFIIB domain-containing protein [Paracoccaceae bacterium]